MADVQFHPMDAEFLANPYPTYHRLRSEDPVHHNSRGFWVLTRYDDVVAVLRDPRMVKEAIASVLAARSGFTGARSVGFSMTDRDPPDHTRLRGLVSKAFTPRVVDHLRPRVEAIVDDLLARVDGQGTMDLMEDFAYPIPMVVICELIGVPVADRDRFRGWGLDFARSMDSVLLEANSDVSKRGAASRDALTAYFRELVAERRKAPREDLLSGLIAAEDAGDKLSEQEMLAACTIILVAGYETTANLIGNGTLALLRNPLEFRRLREDPSLIGTAVEEVLRYDGPVQRTTRVADEDMTIGGTIVPSGEMVMAFIGAADRDPARFADPDRLDIGRRDNRHVAFGYGIHFCIGAPLARLAGQIAINALAQRLPKLALATDKPEFRMSLTVRGLVSLPVTY